MPRYESIIPKLQMERKLDRVWRTKDGQRIKLRDMEEAHLYRTIQWIERRSLEVGYPITDYYDDDNGNSGTVVVDRHDPLESLELYGYQDFVDVYNYRFPEVNEVKIPF